MKEPLIREERTERQAQGTTPLTAVSDVLALQRAAGNHAVTRVLARAPTASSDDIAKEFGATDWASFKAKRQGQHDTIFGRPVQGLQITFVKRLRDAEKAVADGQNGGAEISPEDWRSRFGISTVGGLRFNDGGGPAGTHGWGLGIDINAHGAPFVMHEAKEKALDAKLAPVYHRIAWLILGHESAIPEAITKDNSTGDTREWFHTLKAESDAMRQYFRMMRNPDDVDWNTVYEDMNDAVWSQLGVGPMPTAEDPLQAQALVRDVLRKQMAIDYATLGAAGGQDVGGGVMTPGLPDIKRSPGKDPSKPPGVADRPFAGREPGEGFMDLHEEVVVALRAQNGVRWGAVDFGGESGDVMHFDMKGALDNATYAAGKKLAEGS